MRMRLRARYRLSPEERYTGLSGVELNQLGTYNAERARGIMHTAQWQAQMAILQARFNEDERARVERRRRQDIA
jgi:hypothetical protein